MSMALKIKKTEVLNQLEILGISKGRFVDFASENFGVCITTKDLDKQRENMSPWASAVVKLCLEKLREIDERDKTEIHRNRII